MRLRYLSKVIYLFFDKTVYRIITLTLTLFIISADFQHGPLLTHEHGTRNE